MSEEELVEAVARAMAEYDYGDGNDEPWEPFAGLARAIIPIVKEADARIAEAHFAGRNESGRRYGHDIAAAIRGEA